MIDFAKDRWKVFNSIVDDENLTSRENLLLLILFRYVNHTTGYASPSRKLLSWCSREISIVRPLPLPESGIQRLKDLN